VAASDDLHVCVCVCVSGDICDDDVCTALFCTEICLITPVLSVECCSDTLSVSCFNSIEKTT